MMINRIKNKLRRRHINKMRSGVPLHNELTLIQNNGNWFDPVICGPSSFVSNCFDAKTISGVLEVSKMLSPDEWLKATCHLYETGLERFGPNWKYADLNTVLYAISKQIKITSYLEIGVRRGRSMALVAKNNPDAKIVGFDMWIQNYAGMENPGPDFVQKELKKVGYHGNVEFVGGNSRQTVPEYFKKNPEAFFDLITVDGDHTGRGASIDLKNVIPRLKVGGVLVFDDISNPYVHDLKKVWQKMVVQSGRFLVHHYDEVGYGVAFGIKRY